MTSVTNYGNGYWCYRCQEAHESTDVCDHFLSDKAGIEDTRDGYIAQPNNMGHHASCVFTEVDGLDMCSMCERVKIPDEIAEDLKGDSE